MPDKTPLDCRQPCQAASLPHEQSNFSAGYRTRDPQPHPQWHCDRRRPRRGALSCPDRRDANHMA